MDDRQRYVDVLRAESAGCDVADGSLGVHVFAMRDDGSLYELGFVSYSLVAQDPEAARVAIGKIKFAKRKEQ